MTKERLEEIAARARGEDVRWDILPSNFDQVKALCILDGRGCLREQEGGTK